MQSCGFSTSCRAFSVDSAFSVDAFCGCVLAGKNSLGVHLARTCKIKRRKIRDEARYFL